MREREEDEKIVVEEESWISAMMLSTAFPLNVWRTKKIG